MLNFIRFLKFIAIIKMGIGIFLNFIIAIHKDKSYQHFDIFDQE